MRFFTTTPHKTHGFAGTPFPFRMTERTVEDAGPYIGNDKFLCITGITQEFEICVHRDNKSITGTT